MQFKSILIFISLLASQLMAQDSSLKKQTQVLEVSITEKGFEPESFTVVAGTEVVLKAIRSTENTCAKELMVSATKEKKKLPLNEPIEFEMGNLKKGTHSFYCGMKMLKGTIKAQ